ncbi:hypothetical protein CBER1_08155 [Cercospora berteroae]|uniref:Uncharacterized protein n=1 Tax=Cercospora berteroae TaxID=357750 RepID=A0A2S6CLF5_9PEZI|nr:hypothetical protein CBER1_08155 [Cercospora berteroae]
MVPPGSTQWQAPGLPPSPPPQSALRALIDRITEALDAMDPPAPECTKSKRKREDEDDDVDPKSPRLASMVRDSSAGSLPAPSIHRQRGKRGGKKHKKTGDADHTARASSHETEPDESPRNHEAEPSVRLERPAPPLFRDGPAGSGRGEPPQFDRASPPGFDRGSAPGFGRVHAPGSARGSAPGFGRVDARGSARGGARESGEAALVALAATTLVITAEVTILCLVETALRIQQGDADADVVEVAIGPEHRSPTSSTSDCLFLQLQRAAASSSVRSAASVAANNIWRSSMAAVAERPATTTSLAGVSRTG